MVDLIEEGDQEALGSGNRGRIQDRDRDLILVAKHEVAIPPPADHLEDPTADVKRRIDQSVYSTVLRKKRRKLEKHNNPAPIEDLHQRRSGGQSVPPGI